MTILNFALHKEAVYLVADTMVSDPTDMAPINFTTKVFPVPHWQALICGTGILQFIVDWHGAAVTSVVARDIRHLDEFAPEVLRELFSKYREDGGRKLTSTIYHLGYDQAEARFIGFAYRSTSDFASEELAYGIRLKPAPENQPVEIRVFPDDFITTAEAQKISDESKTIEHRVGIGGHLISYAMQLVKGGNEGCQVATTISRCHQFSDFPAAYLRACEKLPITNIRRV